MTTSCRAGIGVVHARLVERAGFGAGTDPGRLRGVHVGDRTHVREVHRQGHRLQGVALHPVRAGAGHDVAVPGRVDGDLRADRLSPLARLDEAAEDRMPVDDRVRREHVQQEVDARLLEHLVGNELHLLRVGADHPAVVVHGSADEGRAAQPVATNTVHDAYAMRSQPGVVAGESDDQPLGPHSAEGSRLLHEEHGGAGAGSTDGGPDAAAPPPTTSTSTSAMTGIVSSRLGVGRRDNGVTGHRAAL